AACFGIAGPIIDGRSSMPNLGWTIDAVSLGRLFALERVVLLNDLEATGYGIAALPPDQLVVLNAGVPAPGNAALIAAGTGRGDRGAGARRRVAALRPRARRLRLGVRSRGRESRPEGARDGGSLRRWRHRAEDTGEAHRRPVHARLREQGPVP